MALSLRTVKGLGRRRGERDIEEGGSRRRERLKEEECEEEGRSLKKKRVKEENMEEERSTRCG